MTITYQQATNLDAEEIFSLCRQLILDYEDPQAIDLPLVLDWVHHKIQSSISEYTADYADGQKAGYYHFYRNEEGDQELDDLYIFPAFQNQGIGSQILRSCLDSCIDPVVLYVFIKNVRAVALYKRFGFEIVKVINGTRYLMRSGSRC